MTGNIAFAMSFVPVALMAQETKMQMKDLPSAVQKTVHELTRTAKLRGLSKEVERGKTFYEAETTVDGKSRDVLIDPSGAVVDVEEATTITSIPEAVRRAFQQQGGSTGKVLSVETVTKRTVVDYEAVIQKGGKKSEVAVHADGSPVKEE